MPTLERDTHRIYYELHNPHDLSTRPLVLLHGLGSVPRLPLVPAAVAVFDLVRPHLEVAEPRAQVPGEELLRARVVLGGELAR